MKLLAFPENFWLVYFMKEIKTFAYFESF